MTTKEKDDNDDDDDEIIPSELKPLAKGCMRIIVLYPPGHPAGGFREPSGALPVPSVWHVALTLAHKSTYKTTAEFTIPC